MLSEMLFPSLPPSAPRPVSVEPSSEGSQSDFGTSSVPVRTRYNRARRDKAEERRKIGEEALLAAYALCGVSQKSVKSDPLYVRYRKLSTKTGVEEGLRDLKKESGKFRSAWILNGAPDRLGQLSFLGRALPSGTAETAKASLAQHRIDLTTPWNSTDKHDLVSSLRAFVARWSKKRVAPAGRMPAPDLPTRSSCLESRTREGGLRGYAARSEADTSESFSFAEGIQDPVQAEDLSPQFRLLQTGLAAARPYLDGQLPLNRVAIIRERGLKVRVVTCSPAGLQLLGHPIRKRILAGLRKTGSAAMPLQGLPDSALGEHLKGATTEVVVSTDLTRASDLIPLELADAVLLGLQDAGKLSDWEMDVARLLCGPQRIRYPDGTEITSCRGILMGNPLTWCLLSLIHTWWWDRSIDQSRGETPAGTAYRLNKYITCGDDAIFCGTRATSDAFSNLVALCGGVPSPGKHFVSHEGERRAVFLERLFKVRSEGGLLSRLVRVDAVPVRGLVRPDVPLAIAKDFPLLNLPAGLKLILAVDSAIESNPSAKPALEAWCDRRAPWLRTYASKLGLLPGPPVRLGGFPLGTWTHASLRRAAKMRAYRFGGVNLLIKRKVDPTWQMCEEMVSADVSEWKSRGELQDRAPDAPPPLPLRTEDGHLSFTDEGGYQSVLSQKVAELYLVLAMAMPEETRTRSMNFRTLRRQLRRHLDSAERLHLEENEIPTIEGVLVPLPEDRLWTTVQRDWSGNVLQLRWTPKAKTSDAHLRYSFMKLRAAGAPGP